MKTLSALKTLQGESAAAIGRMESQSATLNALIERLEADTSRSREYTLEVVKDARNKALPALSDAVNAITAAAKEAAPQRRFWESAALLMSLRQFDDDPSKDSLIKAHWRAEFENMPAQLLQLTFENAQFDNNLPLLWLAFSTGARRGEGNAGFAGAITMSLGDVVVPEQAAALAAIEVCDANVGRAEMIFAVATGLRTDPVRKMNVARQQAEASRLVSAASAVSP
ncbi:MAG: hypothetical protein ACSLE5_05555 [Porticoccaceae bacterium]